MELEAQVLTGTQMWSPAEPMAVPRGWHLNHLNPDNGAHTLSPCHSPGTGLGASHSLVGPLQQVRTGEMEPIQEALITTPLQ